METWWKPIKNNPPMMIPCKLCGKLINRHDGRTGICRVCLTKSGYFKEQWKNPEYRRKVIDGATGKKRSDDFKRKQSENMKLYYQQHPERRAAQGQVFSKAWADGRHTTFNIAGNVVYQHSVAENMMFEALRHVFGDRFVIRGVLKNNTNDTRRRSVYPDALVNFVWMIEYNGDYFHANPELYSADDVVCFNQKAFDIWDNDASRIEYAKDCVSCTDLETGETFDAFPTIVTVIWEHETAHLKTQSDWNTYIENRFLGYDELLSI